MASFERGASPTLSMREKNLLKRRINKEHNSNFRAGYVHINEEQLHKTGIRGRKRYIIYCVVALMLLAAIVNLFLTVTILGVLQINKDGSSILEFTPGGQLLRFLGDSDMGVVYPVQNEVGSLPDREMEISAQSGQFVKLVAGANDSAIQVDESGIKITTDDHFEITDPVTGQTIFTTDFVNNFKFPDETKNLKVSEAYTHRVSSAIGAGLRVQAADDLHLEGSEGIQVDGRDFSVTAEGDVDLNTKQHLTLDGQEVYIEQVKQMAAATRKKNDPSLTTYKICVCVPSGKLFAVPAPNNCLETNEDKNPCLD